MKNNIQAKVIEDNIIHVTVVRKGSDGYNYEQIYYLDFNKLTSNEHQISFDHNNCQQRTKVRLTFEDIPVSKIIKWKQDEEDDPL